MCSIYFFFNATATTEIYTYGHTLSRHDALPIYAPRNAHDFHLRPRQFGSRCRLWKIPLRDASSQDGIVAPTVDGFGISRTYGAYGGATVYCRVAVGEEPRSAGVRRGGERGWGDRHRDRQ